MAAAPRAGTHTEPRFERKNQIKSTKNVALHFRANATPLQAKSMTYATSTRANCRRWVKPSSSWAPSRLLSHGRLSPQQRSVLVLLNTPLRKLVPAALRLQPATADFRLNDHQRLKRIL